MQEPQQSSTTSSSSSSSSGATTSSIGSIILGTQQLLLFHTTLDDDHASSLGQLEIRLVGYTPKPLIDTIDKHLHNLGLSLGLIHGIPGLRLEQGYWSFSTAVSAWYFGEILMTGFINPIGSMGYVHVPEANAMVRYSSNTNDSTSESPLLRRRRLCCIQFTISNEHTATLGPIYRIFPPASTIVGGNMTEIQPHPKASLLLLPRTCFDLTPFAQNSFDGGVVIGAGWDAGRNKTYEMIHGPQAVPDIDLCIELINKFGEIMSDSALSPKGARSFPGIQLSLDETTGNAIGDDERCALDLSGIPNRVHALIVRLKIVPTRKGGGAEGGFGQIRNTYLRMLDLTTTNANELELWRLPVVPESHNKRMMQVDMARIERTTSKSWRAVTLGDFHHHGYQPKERMPNAVVLSNVSVYVPAMDKVKRSGSSDVYMIISYREVVTKKGLFSETTQDRVVELVRTDVREKTPCPAWVSLEEVKLNVPINKTYGTLGECSAYGGHGFQIEVYDKEPSYASDDLIFRTDVDMKSLFASSNKEVVEFKPNHCTDSWPRPKSGTLNKTDVNLHFANGNFKFKATLELKFQQERKEL